MRRRRAGFTINNKNIEMEKPMRKGSKWPFPLAPTWTFEGQNRSDVFTYNTAKAVAVPCEI